MKEKIKKMPMVAREGIICDSILAPCCGAKLVYVMQEDLPKEFFKRNTCGLAEHENNGILFIPKKKQHKKQEFVFYCELCSICSTAQISYQKPLTWINMEIV